MNRELRVLGGVTFRIIEQQRTKCSVCLLRSCGSKGNGSEQDQPVLAVHRERELPSLLLSRVRT